MGRIGIRPHRVHQHATRLLELKRIDHPPPWYDVLATVPPSEINVRKAMSSKRSRMFKPLKISYPEDKLRQDFFKDHPWELARPRVILENTGNDAAGRDWSRIKQPGKKLDGESVVQRQMWLMNAGLPKYAAYDQARKEFYRIRHQQEVEQRIAKEEALSTGAYFGKSPLEIGMELEDKAWEDWKQWALRESQLLRQAASSSITGLAEMTESEEPALADETANAIPLLDKEQGALGGAAAIPAS